MPRKKTAKQIAKEHYKEIVDRCIDAIDDVTEKDPDQVTPALLDSMYDTEASFVPRNKTPSEPKPKAKKVPARKAKPRSTKTKKKSA